MKTVNPTISKLSILKDFMAAGNHRAALKLAASWGKRGLGGGAHAEAITKAWQATSTPDFYRSIGQNPDEIVEAGVAAILERYDIRD